MEVRYRFTATGAIGTREVFPQNGNTLSVSYEKENGKAFFSKKLKGKILFTSDDFKWFLIMEQSQYRCDPITMVIEKFCPNGGLSTIFIARLSFNKGDFNLDECQLNIQADELDKYTCYNDTKSEEKNLLSSVFPTVQVNLLQGNIETKDCSGDQDDPLWCDVPAEQANGWIVLKYDQTFVGGVPPTDLQPYNFTVTWVRELIISATPLTAPWISIGGTTYARVPALYGYTSYQNDFGSGYSYKVGGVIDNGMPLKKCFEVFTNTQCNLKLKSDFFQWNPDTITNINYVTGAVSKVLNLILFQTSDVKRAGALNNATRAEISFEDLLNDICNTFNLLWDIDDNGRFVIEHVSFFIKPIGLDLVNRHDAYLRAGTRRYTYDNDNMPRRELFTMQNAKYQYGDFGGTPIIYQNSCVGKGDKEDKDWQVENIMTDLELALKNGSPDNEIVPDEGFVLVACDATNGIISEASIFSGNVLNNSLSWAHLHIDYWRHSRVFRSFLMNNVQTAALSTIPTKKQVKLTVKICCGDTFNPDQRILSTLGTGVVADAQYNIFLETLELNLLFDAEAGLVLNNPPVANVDNVSTFQNVAIDIDVLANDTDSDGTINPSTLQIIFQPTHGVASVVNGKIRYVPNNGYFGSDIITYLVKDNWSQVSNNGILNINVKAGSPLPIATDDAFATVKNTTLTVGDLLNNDSGDGALSCVAETKATTAGGTVQIFANGSFTYTPPINYIGADSFDYTLVDSNSNTDLGTASITITDRLTVYARLTTENNLHQKISEYCEGNLEIVGSRDTQDLRIRYYSDVAGTIPLNISAYNINVGIRETRTGTGAGSFDNYLLATGVDDVQNVVYQYNYEGCDLAVSDTYSSIFDLVPSSDYTII